MKYVLITGASGGIGLATAKALKKEGYGLYLHYYTNRKHMEEVFGQDDSVYYIQGDLTTSCGVKDVLAHLQHPLEGLIYCAGTSEMGLVTDFEEDDYEQMMTIHQKSLYFLVNGCLRDMISKRNGSIVVVTSIWGQTGASCEVLYSMAKGGQIAYIKALAKEVALSGVRVNGVAPGAVRTNMLSSFTEEDVHEMSDEIPMGRLGKAEEIADVISFLISQKSSYMTGAILNVNGGWYC